MHFVKNVKKKRELGWTKASYRKCVAASGEQNYF